jgi:flagellar basal-body rod protein FlgB
MNTDTITLLNKVLDGAALRHQALAANIANINTPGYQRKDVPFMDDLRSALASTDTDALSKVKPQVREDRGSSPIRLEAEFAALSQNHLLYVSSAEIISRKYERLRRAIRGN